MENKFEFGSDRSHLPARLTFAAKFANLMRGKLGGLIADTDLTDGQKAHIANSKWFEAKGLFNTRQPMCNLTLLDADAFSIMTVGAQDASVEEFGYETNSPEDKSGNFSVDIRLFRDGSPFVYDEDLDMGTTEYTLLLGPEMPPTLINFEYLPEFGVADGGGFGNWRDLSLIIQKVGKDVTHPLSDQDCENVLLALEMTNVDVNGLVEARRRDPEFGDL